MRDPLLTRMIAHIDAADWSRPRRTLIAQGVILSLARSEIDTQQARERLMAAGWDREQSDRIISNELRKIYNEV